MDTQLMETFHFDQEDLTANRTGLLSGRQEKQKQSDEAWANRVILVLALLAAAGAVLLLLPFVRSGQLPESDEITRAIFGVLLALVSLWFFRGALFTRVDNTVLKAQGKLKLVKSVRRSGSVSNQESSRRNITHYEMVVAGHTFGVDPHTFNTVLLEREDETFVVYFTRNPESILSLEQLSSTQD